MRPSINRQLEDLAKLLKTPGDLTDWEQSFLRRVVPEGLAKLTTGRPTTFTDPQIEKIEQIWRKHFDD